MKSLKWKPHFVVIVCGSNDADDIDRYARSRARRGLTDRNFREETAETLANWYKDLKFHQAKLVSKIRSIYKNVHIHYLPIMPRKWWGQQGRRVAILLNRNMSLMENVQPLNVCDLYCHKSKYQTG